MKYSLILILASTLLFGSCEQGMETLYEPYNGVYFSGEFNQGVFIPTDSMTVSFGLRDASIRYDTVRINVSFLGRQSNQRTAFKVQAIKQSTLHEEFRNDMEEGVHYLPLEEYYYFAEEYPNSKYAPELEKRYAEIEAYLENYNFEE